jgi:hypothetical protein
MIAYQQTFLSDPQKRTGWQGIGFVGKQALVVDPRAVAAEQVDDLISILRRADHGMPPRYGADRREAIQVFKVKHGFRRDRINASADEKIFAAMDDHFTSNPHNIKGNPLVWDLHFHGRRRTEFRIVLDGQTGSYCFGKVISFEYHKAIPVLYKTVIGQSSKNIFMAVVWCILNACPACNIPLAAEVPLLQMVEKVFLKMFLLVFTGFLL